MSDRKQFAATPRRPARAARGITLIETAVVMAASIVLLSATATALVAVHRADRHWSQRVDELRSREQMLRKLRRDVHAAQEFAWDPANATLRLAMADGGDLTYQRRPRRWERRLKPAANDDQVDTTLTSAFPAPSDVAWEVTPVDGGVGDLIHIRMVPSPKQPAAAGEDELAAELVVTVGRDWRLLHQ